MSIRSEIEQTIITWANAQTPKIPVALENIPFTKPTTGSYLEVFFLDSAIINPTVDATREREKGLVQVNVCVPIGKGSKAGDALRDSVKALFPVIPKTGTVSIERPPQHSKGYPRDDGFWAIPITISYRQER